jgi:hypothetical protein
MLGKWRWRILDGDIGLWKDILCARYGAVLVGTTRGGSVRGLRYSSAWWKCVSLLEPDAVSNGDWFLDGITRVTRDGAQTLFWEDVWVGHVSLRERFPRFFQISTQQSSCVRSLCSWVGGRWAWDLSWRRRLFVWEVNLLEELFGVLEGHSHAEGPNFWSWKYSVDKIYSIKSVYNQFSDIHLGAGSRATSFSHILALVWKSWAPSKVHVFSWQLLLDRIPTRMNLLRSRGFFVCVLWWGGGDC